MLIKVAVVLFVIAVGLQYVTWENWTGVPVPEVIPSQSADKWGLIGLIGLGLDIGIRRMERWKSVR